MRKRKYQSCVDMSDLLLKSYCLDKKEVTAAFFVSPTKILLTFICIF